MPENNTFETLNSKIIALSRATKKTDILFRGLDVADEIMHIIGIPYDQIEKGEDMLEKAFPNSKFNTQKVEKWFEQNPIIDGARVALNHYDKGVYPVESKFYMLSDSPRKEKIAYTSQLFPNWEDGDMYMIPQYKVGIDFFLNQKAKSLLFVVSKRGILRVVEFSGKLSHTQIEILNNIQNCALYDGLDLKTKEPIPFEPQRTIHNTLWNALELKEVNKKFYIGIAEHFALLCQYLKEHVPEGVEASTIDATSKIFANRIINRLLFVWFLRKKEIINKDYNYFDIGNDDSSDYYENKLKPLFFNTLNIPVEDRPALGDLVTPYLNGGLFEAHETDWPNTKVPFPTGWFNTLYAHLDRFNFTTDESSAEYEQVAIDPEMLGRVFENLLASIVSETASAANERNNKGAFYTPREIVSYMCKVSLKEYFKRNVSSDKYFAGIDNLIDMSDNAFLSQKSSGLADLWGVSSTQVREQLAEAINKLKILDPACGSGAFPIGMLQLLLKTCDRLSLIYDEKLGKMRLVAGTEPTDTYKTKLFLIRNCLYGVDIEPMAAEISRLRAWLSLIIDDKTDIEPLPNLDFNFVCANTLVKLPSYEETNALFVDKSYEERFQKLRNKYFDTHSKKEKDSLREKFHKIYNEQYSNDDMTISERYKKLKTWDPFKSIKPAQFFNSEIMFNVKDFSIVIGNPPYISLSTLEDEMKKLYISMDYNSYDSSGDIYCLFIEKGLEQLQEGGVLTYITSNKWMKSGYGEKLRNYLAKYNPLLLLDFGNIKIFNSATVDSNILQISKEINQQRTIACKLDNGNKDNMDNLNALVSENSILNAYDTSDTWLILSPIEKSIKDKIEKAGTPLNQWNIQINYGIKTGCNKAFVIDSKKREEILSNCHTEDERKRTAEIIRPVLRGKDIKRYSYIWKDKYLINFHNGQPSSNVLRLKIEDYPAIKEHFDHFYDELIKRTDQGDSPYNLRSCAYLDDFNKLKLAYTPVNSEYKFALIPKEYLFNNSLFIITGDDIDIICAICNSFLIRFYLSLTLSNESYQYGSGDYFKALPLLMLDDNNTIKQELKSLVLKMSKAYSNDVYRKINQLINHLYGLTPTEEDYINNYLYNTKNYS